MRIQKVAYSRKGVHSALNEIALNAENGVDCLVDQIGPLGQRIQHRFLFFSKELIRRFAQLRRIDDAFDNSLMESSSIDGLFFQCIVECCKRRKQYQSKKYSV